MPSLALLLTSPSSTVEFFYANLGMTIMYRRLRFKYAVVLLCTSVGHRYACSDVAIEAPRCRDFTRMVLIGQSLHIPVIRTLDNVGIEPVPRLRDDARANIKYSHPCLLTVTIASVRVHQWGFPSVPRHLEPATRGDGLHAQRLLVPWV